MSILKYFKRNKEGYPDPRDDLSLSISPRVIALANCKVEIEQKKPKKYSHDNVWLGLAS